MRHRIKPSRLLSVILASVIIGLALSLGGRVSPVVPDLAKKPMPARNWPMFGGTSTRNLVAPFEKNLPATWDVDPKKRKNIKWVANLGSRSYGGPIVADGRIFVGTNNLPPREPKWNYMDKRTGKLIDLGVLVCFRESDGEYLWQHVHEKLPGGQVMDWPLVGIVSTPVVEGDRLYYVSNRCEVICANVVNGAIHWKFDMMEKLVVFPHNMSACSPLIVGDLVMVVTSNGVDADHITIPSPQAPSFIAVNKVTGKVAWQSNLPTAKVIGVKQTRELNKELANRGEIVLHGQWGNPAAGVIDGLTQIVFPGGDGWLYSFTPDGKLIWKFDANPKNAKYELAGKGTRNDFPNTPVIYKNRVYIGMGQDPEHRTGVGHFWCIDMTKKGDVSSEIRIGNKIVPNPNSAVVWHYGGPIADPKEVRRLRRNYLFGRTLSTCAIHDDLVYIPDIGGVLHCLDANTGKLQWEHDSRADIWGSPLIADGKVYLGNDDEFHVFAHGRNKNVLAQIDMENRIRCTPVACNGALYITTENKLYAIALER